MTNEEIRDGLNKLGHLGFLDWTFEIAHRTQQLVFFSPTQMRSGQGPHSVLYPESARLIVSSAELLTALKDLSGVAERDVFIALDDEEAKQHSQLSSSIDRANAAIQHAEPLETK